MNSTYPTGKISSDEWMDIITEDVCHSYDTHLTTFPEVDQPAADEPEDLYDSNDQTSGTLLLLIQEIFFSLISCICSHFNLNLAVCLSCSSSSHALLGIC
jgi:hypothetical protein